MKLRSHTRSKVNVKLEETSNDTTLDYSIELDVKEKYSNEASTVNQATSPTITTMLSDYPNVEIKEEDTTQSEIKLNKPAGMLTRFFLKINTVLILLNT